MLGWALLAAALAGSARAQTPTFPPQVPSFTDRDLDEFELGGYVEFMRAAYETDITFYAMYFGSSATTTQSLLANLPIGAPTKINLGMNFPLPAHATHFLVYSANNNGIGWDMGVSLAIHDKHVPINPALGLVFVDQDLTAGEIGGQVTISRAVDDSDATHYAVYFGSSASTPLQIIPGGYVPTSMDPLVLDVPNGILVPSLATHLLAYTWSPDGLTYVPAATPLHDKGVPSEPASFISFVDADMGIAEVSGPVTIGKASDEALINNYALYFAEGEHGPLHTLLGLVAPTGADVTFQIVADTPVPHGVTHLHVRTRSSDGEMSTGIGLLILDKAIPVNPPTNLQFLDTDIDRGELGGAITITKAADESDITHYSLFYGDQVYELVGGPITTLAKGPNKLTHTVAINTVFPPDAAYLIAVGENADGPALPVNGRIIALVDKAIPLNPPVSIAFSDEDADGGQLGGTVTLQRAINEVDVTMYTCYYGTGSGATAADRLFTTPIGTVHVAGLASSYATFPIGGDTPVPTGATHLLGFSKNADGEIRVGISMPITDRTLDFPTVTVQGVQFTDIDLDLSEVGGPLLWYEPINTAGLTKYNIYLAVDGSGTLRVPLGDAAIGTTIFTVPHDTLLYAPGGVVYTHVLVYTENNYGEALAGHAELVVDRAIPVALVLAVSFLDEDPGYGLVGGEVAWTLPVNLPLPTEFLSFTVYLAEAANGDGQMLLGEASSPTATSFRFPLGTATANFTHVLVYTKNVAGEALLPASALLVDLWLPPGAVRTLQFFDEDLGTGEIGGKIEWIEPENLLMVGTYRIYFEEDDGSQVLFGEVPHGSVSLPVPFNTLIGNFTQIVAVAANAVGESLLKTNISIVDRTAESCPADFGHRHTSWRWRLVGGPTQGPWKVRALRFFSDPACLDRLPTVPKGWPKLPRQTQGEPFNNPPTKTNIFEIFRVPETARTWQGGMELPLPADHGPWWSSGGPCDDLLNLTVAAPVEFDPDLSGCFLGWSWESNSFIQAGQVRGSMELVAHAGKSVHCVEIEQSERPGEFAEHLALQWYDPARIKYRTLLQRYVTSGGFTQLAYQRVLAAECGSVA